VNVIASGMAPLIEDLSFEHMHPLKYSTNAAYKCRNITAGRKDATGSKVLIDDPTQRG